MAAAGPALSLVRGDALFSLYLGSFVRRYDVWSGGTEARVKAPADRERNIRITVDF